MAFHRYDYWIAAWVFFVSTSVALCTEETARNAISVAKYGYQQGDHDIAFRLLEAAAKQEEDEAVKTLLLDTLDSLRKDSTEKYALLGPLTQKRIVALRETLLKDGYEGVKSPDGRTSYDELRWAFFGQAKPYVLEALRKAEERAKAQDTHKHNWMFEALDLQGYDARISFRLSYNLTDRMVIARYASRLKARDSFTDRELERAANEPLLQDLYKEFVKAGGTDPKRVAEKNAAAQAATQAKKDTEEAKKDTEQAKKDTEIEQWKRELTELENRIAPLQAAFKNAQAKLDRIDRANSQTALAKRTREAAIEEKGRITAELDRIADEIKFRRSKIGDNVQEKGGDKPKSIFGLTPPR